MGCKETDINRLGRWFHDNVSEICRKHYLRNVPLEAAICMSGVPTGEFYRIPRAAVESNELSSGSWPKQLALSANTKRSQKSTSS